MTSAAYTLVAQREIPAVAIYKTIPSTFTTSVKWSVPFFLPLLFC